MKIVKEPNKMLHKKLSSVNKLPAGIGKVILGMKEVMLENQGIGLAANQVGLDMQLFIIDENIAQEYKVPSVYINPKITSFSKDKDEMEEGCLSVPEYYTFIKRSKKIMIKAIDENSKKFKFKARGMLARILQHEYDHLQGILIKDKKV